MSLGFFWLYKDSRNQNFPPLLASPLSQAHCVAPRRKVSQGQSQVFKWLLFNYSEIPTRERIFRKARHLIFVYKKRPVIKGNKVPPRYFYTKQWIFPLGVTDTKLNSCQRVKGMRAISSSDQKEAEAHQGGKHVNFCCASRVSVTAVSTFPLPPFFPLTFRFPLRGIRGRGYKKFSM